jgi:hypothetical protein
MKLIENTTTIEHIGTISNENEFKMKSSRKAFQILSDLYSDKPLAIVRELGCNANDSHVASGNPDRPFAIHLPNTLEPWLTIQDFGTGITHENIYNIYCVYFESTKTNTNDQIGCLGLGSKSPFCYTDTFTITSITDGMKRIYNAFFNEQSTPAIALVSTSPTTEETGVAIQIPIKTKDFDSFANAVKKAFRFFDNKPIITGGKIDWKEDKPMFQGEGWKSYEKFDYGMSYAIMGGVTYPIEANKIDTKYHSMVTKGGLVIHFKMGEVDFTPSREQLSYCDSTIKSLNAKLEFIKKDFAKRINDILAEKENIFEALQMVYTLKTKFAYIDGFAISDSIKWNDIEIGDPLRFIRTLLKDVNGMPCMTYYKPSYYRQKVAESSNAEIGTNAMWYYDDLERGGLSRVRSWVRGNEDSKITLFTKDAHALLLGKGFPADTFKPVSSLPRPAKVARKRNGVVQAPAQRTKGSYNIYTIGESGNKSWEAEEIDPTSNPTIPKYYLVKNKENWLFEITHKDLTITINEKDKLTRLLSFMGVSSNDIMMVSERNVKHLPKSCIELKKYVEEKIDFSITEQAIATLHKYPNNRMFQDAMKHKLFASLDKANPFRVWIEGINEVHTKYGNFNQTILPWLKKKHDPSKVVKLQTNNKAIHMITNNMGRYAWEIDTCITIISSLKD